MVPAVPDTPLRAAMRRFLRDPGARLGIAGLLILLLPALYAPLLANGRPLWMSIGGTWSSPALEFIFSPDSAERLTEQCFNFAAMLLPAWLLLRVLFRRRPRLRRILLAAAAIALALPFAAARPRLDRTDYRTMLRETGGRALFAPIACGPFETAAAAGAPPSREHPLGTDAAGRDVAARLIYGARVSLAVGIASTAIALLIGVAVGLAAGFRGGWFDLAVMRIVEVLMCFPTFLLLLILMSMAGDRQAGESVPVVVGVLGLTGWIGLALLVRAETLRQKALPYIAAGIGAGIPAWRIMFRHLLPNVSAPILISFTFGVAGAILSESGLSFLGFGVQPPTASWGELLRQAFENPLDQPLLTVAPGAALFLAVLSINLTGEGLRKALDVKE